MSKKRAIVLDIDGVILNTEFIFKEIFEKSLKGDEGWNYFHKYCNSERVELIPNFLSFYSEIFFFRLKGDISLILLTSRNEKVKEQTVEKLKKEGIIFDEICMRPDGDYRESHELKQEALQQLQETYDIFLYVDDDLKNCEAAKELGIFSVRKV